MVASGEGKGKRDGDVKRRDECIAGSLDDLIKEFSLLLFLGLGFVWRRKLKQMTHRHR